MRTLLIATLLVAATQAAAQDLPCDYQARQRAHNLAYQVYADLLGKPDSPEFKDAAALLGSTFGELQECEALIGKMDIPEQKKKQAFGQLTTGQGGR